MPSKSRKEKLQKKNESAIKYIGSLIKCTEAMKKYMPKTGMEIPPTSETAQEYTTKGETWTLQQILDDFHQVALDYEAGLKKLDALFNRDDFTGEL